MSIILVNINSSDVIEKLRLRSFQGSQVSSLTFPLNTLHCHMILSKQKCFLLLTGVSIESTKCNSVLQTKLAFLATRNMTRINIGLALSYAKLLLSSWKAYMCNLNGMVHGDSYRIYFYIVMRGILCLTFTNLNGITL